MKIKKKNWKLKQYWKKLMSTKTEFTTWSTEALFAHTWCWRARRRKYWYLSARHYKWKSGCALVTCGHSTFPSLRSYACSKGTSLKKIMTSSHYHKSFKLAKTKWNFQGKESPQRGKDLYSESLTKSQYDFLKDAIEKYGKGNR